MLVEMKISTLSNYSTNVLKWPRYVVSNHHVLEVQLVGCILLLVLLSSCMVHPKLHQKLWSLNKLTPSTSLHFQNVIINMVRIGLAMYIIQLGQKLWDKVWWAIGNTLGNALRTWERVGNALRTWSKQHWELDTNTYDLQLYVNLVERHW
jgi:hypothetical protein